jgi:hypothetical protein
MRRTLPFICSLLLTAGMASTAHATVLTDSRQLDLTAQHLAATAAHEVQAGTLSKDQARLLEDLAARARLFHFDLEASQYSVIQEQLSWDEVADTFLTARTAVGEGGSKDLRAEIFRVHSLMNRIDQGMGGTGFWHGRHGWTG